MKRIKNKLIFILIIFSFYSCVRDDSKLLKNEETPIIIITDTGAEIDDQWMLTHLLGIENLTILGVISSHYGGRSGIDESKKSKKIIDQIVELTKSKNIKTYYGSNKKLSSREKINSNISDIIYELLSEYDEDNKVIVIISGPATDIASAIVKYPEIESKVKICATAFHSRELGMSYNVNNDLLAWQILLESDIELTVANNKVSKKAFISNINKLNNITGSSKSDISNYLEINTDNWINSNEEIITSITGDKKIWPIWDQVLTAYILGFCETETAPRPILLDNGYFNYSGSGENKKIKWIVNCNTDSTWDDFKKVIER